MVKDGSEAIVVVHEVGTELQPRMRFRDPGPATWPSEGGRTLNSWVSALHEVEWSGVEPQQSSVDPQHRMRNGGPRLDMWPSEDGRTPDS
ncbi:hypothetical protein ACLOJK_037940 [Asimina triloba]